MLNRYHFAFWLCLCLNPIMAAADDIQSHASIHQAARQFLLEQDKSLSDAAVKISNGNLDSRLRLKQCSKPLEGFMPAGGRTIGKITVGVRCTDAAPWSLQVPMQVSIYRDVVVATQLLPRGRILSADDVRLDNVDLADLPHGYIERTSDSIGMKLKRQLQAGSALTPTIIEAPQIISRGQRVTIIARTGRMEVRVAGKALDHGAAGERIAVVNLTSKQKLEGVVTESGEVMVDL